MKKPTLIPLSRHPAYQELKRLLLKLRFKGGRLPDLTDENDESCHTTDRLHDKKDKK